MIIPRRDLKHRATLGGSHDWLRLDRGIVCADQVRLGRSCEPGYKQEKQQHIEMSLDRDQFR